MKTIEAVSVTIDPARTAELRRKFTSTEAATQEFQPTIDLRVNQFAEQLEQVNVNLATASAVVNSKAATLPQCDVCGKAVRKRHDYSLGPFEARICGKCKKLAEGAGLLLKFVLNR